MTDYPNNIPAKLEIIKASEITPREVRWQWYPYKVTLLQGDPGDGKSKLMLSLAALLVRLAAHVSNGLKSRIRPVVGRI